MYKVYISYKGDASQLNVGYMINGDTDIDNDQYDFTEKSNTNYREMSILNKDFDDWTNNDPDNWRIFANENAGFIQTSTTKIEQSSTGILRFLQASSDVSDGALVLQPKLTTDSLGYTFLVVGQKYKYTIDIDIVTSGACVVQQGSYLESFDSAGVHTGEFTAVSNQMRITADKTVDTDYKLASFKLETESTLGDKSSAEDLEEWHIAELKPTVSSQASNIYSVAVSIAGDAGVDFEINDLTFVYRIKNVK